MIGLRWWRRARGLTQRELAARSGVQQRTISRIESGLVEEPRTSTLAKLAAALGVSVLDLFFGEVSIGIFGAPDRHSTDSPPLKGSLSRGEQPEDITAATSGWGR